MTERKDDRFAALLRAVLEDRAESKPVAADSEWDFWVQPLPILVDVLLSADLLSAVVRLISATRLRYPYLRCELDERSLRFGFDCRQRFLRFADRTRGDTEAIDLCWRLCAALPGREWTWAFADRLRRAATALFDQAPDDTPLVWPLIERRVDKIERLAQSRWVVSDDPIAVLSEAGWEEAAAAGDEAYEKDRLAREASAKDRLNAHLQRQADDALQAVAVPDRSSEGSVRVLRSDATVPAGPIKWLLTSPAPLRTCDDAQYVRELLYAEFPHAKSAIDLLTVDLRDGEPVRLRPAVLVGDAGCGKSRLVRQLAATLAVPLRRFDGAGADDNSFSGTPKQWSSARACYPLLCVAETRTANPILLIDEIEKAGESRYHGSLSQCLLPFFERETSRRYPDPGLDAEVDVSHVSYVATANDVLLLPKPLRDRCRIIHVPSPSVEHLPTLIRQIVDDIIDDERFDPRFVEPFADDEIEQIARAWTGRDRSVRRLQKLVSATLTARAACAPRH